MFDFGGSLGSKARGEFKDAWGGSKVQSEAIGVFENSKDIGVVFGRFHERFKPDGHAWGKVTREDASEAIELLKKLEDSDIEKIVKKAKYSKAEDTEYMIEALKNRRDTLIEKLLDYFPEEKVPTPSE